MYIVYYMLHFKFFILPSLKSTNLTNLVKHLYKEMSPGGTFDVCVIGAGVNGSSAAYQLVKRKKNVLLLEQVI